MGKVKYILENDAVPMELFFQEEEYDAEKGSLIKVNKNVYPNLGAHWFIP